MFSVEYSITPVSYTHLDVYKRQIRCRNMKIDAIYSSPLRRARETAEAVNRFHGLPIQIRDGLREIDGGEMENKPWEDFPKTYPEQASFWNKQPWLFSPPNGETMYHVFDRIWDTILEIIRENPGKTVCAASHGCAIRNFLCRASGWPIEQLNKMCIRDSLIWRMKHVF